MTSDTPAPTSVPNMRVKRTSAKWATTCPSRGVPSIATSIRRLPSLVCRAWRAAITATTAAAATASPHLLATTSEQWMMNTVSPGRLAPNWLNTPVNRGMKNVIRNASTPTARHASTIG